MVCKAIVYIKCSCSQIRLCNTSKINKMSGICVTSVGIDAVFNVSVLIDFQCLNYFNIAHSDLRNIGTVGCFV